MSTPNEQHLDRDAEIITFPGSQEQDSEPVQATAERLTEAVTSTDEVVDAELVEPSTEVAPRKPVVPPALASKASAAAPVVKDAGLTVLRHSYFLVAGAWDTFSTTYGRWTGRDIDAQIAAAQAAGEHAVAADLLRQRAESKKLFLERLKVWGQFLKHLPIGLAGLVGAVFGIVFVASIIAALQPGGLGFTDVWSGFFSALNSGFEFVAWAATWSPWAGLAVLLGVLGSGYNKRRHRQAVPAFLAAPGSGVGEVEVTPSVVVSALRRAGIPALRRAIENMDEHQRAAMLSPIRLAGCGVEVDVTLPTSGDTTVTTEQIRAKRRALAEGLGRHEHEVFITKAEAARTVRFWIADSGALDEPIGESPLVGDGFDKADVFSGKAPWGVTLRGAPFLLKLWQCHLLITGLSNQGKTAALRSLLLWLLLDPSVEVHLADLKGVGDYNMLKPLVSSYIAGPTDEHVAEATVMLEWAVGEMNRRIEEIEANADAYPNGITAALSRDVTSGFHPIVLVVDEAQVAYECPAKDDDGLPLGGSKATSRFFNAVRKIQNQGRAVNVTFWQGTQDPTNENLPIRARNGAHVRASLVVATESQSRMALGDAAVDAGGAAPHELRQGKDKGVLVVKDADNTIETVRTHFIDGTSAEQVAERARIVRAGTRFHRTEPAEQQRDLLDDVATVLEDADKVKATDVVARLRKLAPDHRAYQALDGTKLKDQLATLGVEVKKADGIPTVYTHRVHTALAAREGGSETS
ncbi:FtsK/SpoIIIE domain-containing protein [Saccharopolyspora mangrovi]|uniref:FtsK/SpoIIIE domain-containing protein n=1 Tax=Saccharopolyspora mangrovi TaxID=3082379 RepID=A0ABU6A954_9PSEU|nr:FtsK/SpoIIIE domain-containing protein [Saccharopolyspora sp. S2-29]MEB3368061.1 FtsK/SpoIIIE domain-containing protein [Saccharopolyspora sp. S2-29]